MYLFVYSSVLVHMPRSAPHMKLLAWLSGQMSQTWVSIPLLWLLEWVTFGLRWLLGCIMSLVWFSVWLYHICVATVTCWQNVFWFSAWVSHTQVTLVTWLFSVLGVIQCLSESHVGRDGYLVVQCSLCDSVLEWITHGSRRLLGCSVFLVWFSAWVSHVCVVIVKTL
jgi:hypothetical protein